jgi:hypothetical protein
MVRLVTLLICCLFMLTLMGCKIDLSEQSQRDRALAEKVNEELHTRKFIYWDYVKEIKHLRGTPGNYNFTFLKTDLSAQDVWDWTFRLLLIVDKCEGKVNTGRSSITLNGYMGGDKVVVGKYISGPIQIPFRIALEGKFAEESIVEDFTTDRFREKE